MRLQETLSRGSSSIKSLKTLGPIAGTMIVSFSMMLAMAQPAAAEPSEHPFEIVPGSFHITPSGYQAGAHADWTLTFDLAGKEGKTYNDLRSTVVNYPAGFMASDVAVPTCSAKQLLGQNPAKPALPECPPASQVGTISLDITVESKPVLSTFPLYNMEVTSFGITAELGFRAAVLTQTLPVTVRPQDSGITGTSPNVEETAEPHNVTLTVWGEPASHEHDAERGRACFEQGSVENEAVCTGGGEEAKIPVEPFLANPTSCGTFEESMKADSWEEAQPEEWLTGPLEVGPRSAIAGVGPFTGCERLHFDPSLRVKPTTSSAESPSGLNVSLEVPQTWSDPDTLATSNVKDVKVTLPQGYTVNPSAANGLAVCTPGQYASETAFSAPGAGCPLNSKLGTVTIETPVLAEKVEGSIYLAEPYDNPFSEPGHPNGSLLALYVVAKLPDRGIIVKTAGRVEPNPVTGQLTSTFENPPTTLQQGHVQADPEHDLAISQSARVRSNTALKPC